MRRGRTGAFLLIFSRPIILVLLFVFFSMFTKTFWSPGNWSNTNNIVLQQAPFSILLAACMTISIILKGIDLSQGAAVALITSVCGILLRSTGNSLLAILTALALGCVIGLINGLLIAKIKVPAFVATYSMRWLLNGIALVLLGGRQIYDLGPTFRKLFISNQWTFFIIMTGVVVLLSLLMSRTVFGRQIYATGMNSAAAGISGISTTRITVYAFMISGCVVGLVSIMYLANLGTAESNIGGNFAINALAATLVGGTIIGGGNGSISNAVVGALIMLCLSNGMIQLGVPSVWQQFIVGAVIILSIMMERVLQKVMVRYERSR
jgi:ribose transport system permease protein